MKKDPKDTWQKIWPILRVNYTRTKTYLDYKDPWELLIAVILSAQTTDDGVNKVTKELFKTYPNAKKLAIAPIANIANIIRRVGYFNTKANYIKQTSMMIVKEFGNNVPFDEEKLRTLPGVGRKTAMVVLSHVGKDKNIGIPVDTHVIRFAHRFGLSTLNNPDKIELDLQKIISKKDWKRAAYAIKDYGRKEGRARGYDQAKDPLYNELLKK